MMSSSNSSNHRTKSGLDNALKTLLNNNFDAVTQACIVTLMKILDNILQKPGNDKIRSIRMRNPAFWNKVGERKGGVEYLLACGFELQTPPPALLSAAPSSSASGTDEEFLVLLPPKEDTTHLIVARHMLLTCATHELHMRAEQLPKYTPPPPAQAVNRTGNAPSPAAFDPYKGQRYDATGANQGPDANYVSITEQSLQKLQSKQEQLEQRMQQQLQDRNLVAHLPGSNNSSLAALAAASADESSSASKSDASLLASLYSKQAAERAQKQEGGFTTKSMRDLQKIKKQKVYSHVVLIVQFFDGSSLTGKFLPKETIGTVKQVVSECLLTATTTTSIADYHLKLKFDLYVTPPRRILSDTATLESEGLVPAAKIFVSFQTPPLPSTNTTPGHFLKPHLFSSSGAGAADGSSAAASFPQSRPVVPDPKDATMTDAKPAAAAAAKPKKKESKEEALLKRMMGR
jgi:hypothetical protein